MTDPLSCKMINRMQINTNTNTNSSEQVINPLQRLPPYTTYNKHKR